MFINISNHPSSKWSDEQRKAAVEIGGEIVDIPFPNVPPTAGIGDLIDMAETIIDKINDMRKGGLRGGEDAVHVMGEHGLTHRLVDDIWHVFGITCIHSTTERIVEEKDGQKISTFKFVKFRSYV